MLKRSSAAKTFAVSLGILTGGVTMAPAAGIYTMTAQNQGSLIGGTGYMTISGSVNPDNCPGQASCLPHPLSVLPEFGFADATSGKEARVLLQFDLRAAMSDPDAFVQSASLSFTLATSSGATGSGSANIIAHAIFAA